MTKPNIDPHEVLDEAYKDFCESFDAEWDAKVKEMPFMLRKTIGSQMKQVINDYTRELFDELHERFNEASR